MVPVAMVHMGARRGGTVAVVLAAMGVTAARVGTVSFRGSPAAEMLARAAPSRLKKIVNDSSLSWRGARRV